MFVDQGVLETAGLIVTLAEWYGWAGLAVAAVFLGIGVDRVEPSARGCLPVPCHGAPRRDRTLAACSLAMASP